MDDQTSDQPNLPETASRSANDHFAATGKAYALFFFIINEAMLGDFVQHTARVALARLDIELDSKEKLESHETPEALVKAEPGPRIKKLRSLRQELLELFLASAIDNFETYVVSILREVLRKKPEILKTREQNVTVGYILQFGSLDELKNEIIEGKVNALSYEGFNALPSWCSKKGIPLAVPEEARETVVELIATRNAVVHNRGRIDDKYLRSVKNSKLKKDDKRKILIDDFLKALRLLEQIVIDTDRAAVAKYGLESLPVPRADVSS